MKCTALFLLALLCAPLARAQAPATVTDADEIRAGQALARQFAENQGIAPTPESKYVEAYLQKVGDRVAAHAQRKLPYEFHFDPNPRFKSAVGLPGGQVFVGAGILAYMDTEDQLAFVLSHEIEHIALNQCRDRLTKVLSDQRLSPADADKLKIADFIPGYGHDNELIADRQGLKLVVAAGYNAGSPVRLLQTFLVIAQQMPHSPTEGEKNLQERIAQIQSLLKDQPPPPAETPFALR